MKSLPIIYPSARLYYPLAIARDPLIPKGITVHYTASVYLDAILKESKDSRIGYHILINADGSLYQTCYLNRTVAHAGKAEWLDLSPNRHHLAVAIVNWGELNSKGISWAHVTVPPHDVRNHKGTFWHKATEAQETALKIFCAWCIDVFGVKPEDICGHDECCIPKGRKVDPGRIFSFSMEDLRQFLIDGNQRKGI